MDVPVSQATKRKLKAKIEDTPKRRKVVKTEVSFVHLITFLIDLGSLFF
jgi:hypothetical protein